MSKNPFEDMLGIGTTENGPSVGPLTSDDPQKFHANIDDPAFGLDQDPTLTKLRIDPLSLGNLPKLEAEEETCDDRCAQEKAERVKKCNVLRKRVALALKKAGCPSKVTAYSTGKRATKKKAATKKKTTAKRR